MASQDRRLTAAAGTPRPSWRVLDLVASFKQEQEDDHTSYRVHVLSGGSAKFTDEIAGTGTGNLRSFFANEAGGDRVQSGASGRQTHLQSYLSNCVETRGGVSWLGLSWRYALGMLAYGAFFFCQNASSPSDMLSSRACAYFLFGNTSRTQSTCNENPYDIRDTAPSKTIVFGCTKKPQVIDVTQKVVDVYPEGDRCLPRSTALTWYSVCIWTQHATSSLTPSQPFTQYAPISLLAYITTDYSKRCL